MSLFFFHFQRDLKVKLMLDQHGYFGSNSPDLICAFDERAMRDVH